MELELKACPFCGQDMANIFKSNGRRGVFVYVKCEFCGAQSKTNSTDFSFEDPGIWDSHECELAAQAWNLRAGEVNA